MKTETRKKMNDVLIDYITSTIDKPFENPMINIPNAFGISYEETLDILFTRNDNDVFKLNSNNQKFVELFNKLHKLNPNTKHLKFNYGLVSYMIVSELETGNWYKHVTYPDGKKIETYKMGVKYNATTYMNDKEISFIDYEDGHLEKYFYPDNDSDMLMILDSDGLVTITEDDNVVYDMKIEDFKDYSLDNLTIWIDEDDYLTIGAVDVELLYDNTELEITNEIRFHNR